MFSILLLISYTVGFLLGGAGVFLALLLLSWMRMIKSAGPNGGENDSFSK